MSNWISVKDRLPEAMHEDVSVMTYPHYRPLHFVDGRWETFDSASDTVVSVHGVTHWQPLPPPPASILQPVDTIKEQRCTCELAGPGRGDCEHFIGLPGHSIPGQHDGPDDTVDVYGKPNGWCWHCWLMHQRYEMGAEIDRLKEVIHSMLHPKDGE